MSDIVFVFRAKLDTRPLPTIKNVEATLPAMKKFMQEAVPPFVACDFKKYPANEEDVDLSLDYDGNVVYQKFKNHYRYWGQIVWASRCKDFVYKSKTGKRYSSKNGEVIVTLNYPEVECNRKLDIGYSQSIVRLADHFDWRSESNESYQLACAILLEETGDPIIAQKYYKEFVNTFLCCENFVVIFRELHDWLASFDKKESSHGTRRQNPSG